MLDISQLRLKGAALQGFVLDASGVAVVGPADANENILASILVPAGAMGPNGIIRLTHNWSYTNNANNKTLRVRIGGIGGTIIHGNTVTTLAESFGQTVIHNVNALNVQKTQSFMGHTPATNPFLMGKTASAIDTSAAFFLVLTGQKASGPDTLTLESFLAEIFPT